MTNKSNIHLGSIHDFEAYITKLSHTWSKVYVLVDENTQEHCLPLLFANQDFFSHAEIILVEPGEASKSIEIAYQLWGTMLETGADRKSLLVNLGGGMITDLGGFIASTFKRGIDFIHIPTSLLGQVDAAIGGKNGLNYEGIKNQIGTFNNALVTYLDTSFLETLPDRELIAGLAEVIKYGVTFNKQLISLIDSDWKGNLPELIKLSAELKEEVITNDFLEQGDRKKLNFGHTIGHALETFAKGDLLHGEAVAAGIIVESFISFTQDLITQEELNEIVNTVTSLFDNFYFEAKDFPVLIGLMKNDKKNEGDQINFTLLKGLGNALINQYIAEKDILEGLGYYLSLKDLAN